jgi:ribosomal protein S27AE
VAQIRCLRTPDEHDLSECPWPHPGPVGAEVVDVALEAQREHIFATTSTCVCGYAPMDGPDWERHRMEAALNAVAGTMVTLQRMSRGIPVDTKQPSFTCPHCGRTSWNANDIRERYCGACHWWTGVPELYEPWRQEREQPAERR